MSAVQPMSAPQPTQPAPMRAPESQETIAPGRQAAEVTPTSEPYGSAFDAAHAANVAKINTMQSEQQKRMFGLSVGLRRASAGGFVMPAAPPVALDVTITGTPQTGHNLTGSYAYFDPNGDPEGASTFKWLRDGAAIAGATGKQYALIGADEGHAIAFQVTPVSTVAPTGGTAVTSPPVNATP